MGEALLVNRGGSDSNGIEGVKIYPLQTVYVYKYGIMVNNVIYDSYKQSGTIIIDGYRDYPDYSPEIDTTATVYSTLSYNSDGSFKLSGGKTAYQAGSGYWYYLKDSKLYHGPLQQVFSAGPFCRVYMGYSNTSDITVWNVRSEVTQPIGYIFSYENPCPDELKEDGYGYSLTTTVDHIDYPTS